MLVLFSLFLEFPNQFQFQYQYHTTPRGNFVTKFTTILSSNAIVMTSPSYWQRDWCGLLNHWHHLLRGVAALQTLLCFDIQVIYTEYTAGAFAIETRWCFFSGKLSSFYPASICWLSLEDSRLSSFQSLWRTGLRSTKKNEGISKSFKVGAGRDYESLYNVSLVALMILLWWCNCRGLKGVERNVEMAGKHPQVLEGFARPSNVWLKEWVFNQYLNSGWEWRLRGWERPDVNKAQRR